MCDLPHVEEDISLTLALKRLKLEFFQPVIVLVGKMLEAGYLFDKVLLN